MSHTTPETVAGISVKTPADFDHGSFTKLLVEVRAACGVILEEAACFKEPHANGLPHFNFLVRATGQYRWKGVAEKLLHEHRVHVSFGEGVRTWAENVLYGRVASECKGGKGLDKKNTQWHRQG